MITYLKYLIITELGKCNNRNQKMSVINEINRLFKTHMRDSVPFQGKTK